MNRFRIIAALSLMVLLMAACSGGDEGETSSTTSSTTAAATSTAAATPTTEGPVTGTPGTPVPTTESTEPGDPGEVELITYTVEERIVSESGDGDEVVILLDPEYQGTLTDIDLQNVLADAVERFPPIQTAHVVNTEDAAALVLVPQEELAPEDVQELEIHYLVRLEEGFRMVFTGPFSEHGEQILGS